MTCDCGENDKCMCDTEKCDSCIECNCDPNVCKCGCHGED